MDYDTTTTTTTSTSSSNKVVNQPQHYEAFTPANLCDLILDNNNSDNTASDFNNSSCMSLSYDEVEQCSFDDEEELTDCGGWMQYMTLLFIGTFFCYGLQLVKRMNSIRFTFTTTTTSTTSSIATASRKQHQRQQHTASKKSQQQQQESSSSPRTIHDVVVQQTAVANANQTATIQQQPWSLPSLSFHFRVLMLWVVASAVTNACKC